MPKQKKTTPVDGGTVAARRAALLLRLAAAGLVTTAGLALGTGALDAGVHGGVVVLVVTAALVDVVLAAGFVALARFNRQGRYLAPTATWALGGVGAGYLGAALLRTSLQVSVRMTPMPGNVLDSAHFDWELARVRPPWYVEATTVLHVGCLLAVVGAMALLAAPAVAPLRLLARTDGTRLLPGADSGAGGPAGTRRLSRAAAVDPPTAGTDPAGSAGWTGPGAAPPHTTSLPAVDPWPGPVRARVEL